MTEKQGVFYLGNRPIEESIVRRVIPIDASGKEDLVPISQAFLLSLSEEDRHLLFTYLTNLTGSECVLREEAEAEKAGQ